MNCLAECGHLFDQHFCMCKLQKSHRCRLLDAWIVGFVNRWVRELLGVWIVGCVNRWVWIVGCVNRWVCGLLYVETFVCGFVVVGDSWVWGLLHVRIVGITWAHDNLVFIERDLFLTHRRADNSLKATLVSGS